MRRVIRLSEIADEPTPRHDTYSPDLMEQARSVLVSRNLRYDNATGTVYDDRLGWLSRFSNPADHVPHESITDVMRWEFRAYIANGASRLSRGFEA
jgi:hypothetical protein